jgi:hypothetical protein
LGALIPTIAKIWQKYEYLKNIAIMWQLYWGIFYQFRKDWDKYFFPKSSIIIPLLFSK